MTDEELVKRLRSYAKDQGGWHNIDDTCEEAADRIEDLTAERDAWKEQHAAEALGLHVQMQRADAFEAKLAESEVRLGKAVELLRRHCDPMDMSDADVATLAEIEEEKG